MLKVTIKLLGVMVVHVTRDEMESMGVYEDIGKLEEAVEQFEEDAEDCDEDKAVVFSTLVWLGKLLKEIIK